MRLWDGTYRSRELSSRIEALKTAARRCSSLDDGMVERGLASTIAVLAQKLLDESARLAAVSTFFNAVQKMPLSALQAGVEPELATAMKTWPPKLSNNVFVTLGTAAVNKLVFSDTSRVVTSIEAFLCFAAWGSSSEKDEKLHLGLCSESSRVRVQEHVVLEFCEKMLHLTQPVFTEVMSKLIQQKSLLPLLPTADKNNFTSDDGFAVATFSPYWCKRAYVDLSVLVVLHHAISSSDDCMGSPEFATCLMAIEDRKSEASFRLRVFKTARRAAADGSGEVGPIAWEKISKLNAQGNDKDSVVQQAELCWDDIKPLVTNSGPDSDVLGQVAQWIDEEVTAKVLTLAKLIGRLRVSTAMPKKVIEARRFLQTKLSEIQDALEDSISEGMTPGALRGLFAEREVNEESQGHDGGEHADEIYDLVEKVFCFFDDVGACLGPRTHEAVFAEMRSRMLLIEHARAAAGCVDNIGKMQKWSAVYVEETHTTPCAVQLSADLPNMTAALAELRKMTLVPQVIQYVTCVLDLRSPQRDSATLPLAVQLRGNLPPPCGDIIDAARAYDSVVVLRKEDRDEVVPVVEYVGVMAECATTSLKLKLDGTPQQAIKSNVEKLEASYKKALQMWLKKNKGGPQNFFWPLHDKMKAVWLAAETGDFTGCEWVKKNGDDKDATKEMTAYTNVRSAAVATERIGVAIANLVSKFDEATAAEVRGVAAV